MSQERPDALLKSALEKIVYFEARATQLTNDLATVTAERERLRGDLAQASQREIELRRVVAELEVRATRAHAEREESARVAEALQRERAELLGKILEASRLNHADGADPFDLASFISELRSEVLLRRDGGQGPTPVLVAPAPVAVVEAPVAAPVSHITKEAESLKSQGRLTVSTDELSALERAFPFPGRAEETLFGFSVRELSAPDPSARARAAERLTALGHPAAAPALATALHGEMESSVKVALLGALSALAQHEAVPVVLPQLSASSPDVRIAALKALLKLDPTQAGPHLAAAVKDPDSAVRRRASLLALGLKGAAALELGETAIRDENADVRSLAALVLGASGMESARPWLMQAMRDPELRVRRSASQALSRLLGQDVSQLVELDEAQRRREVRRLAQVPSNPVKAKVVAAVKAAQAGAMPGAPTNSGHATALHTGPASGATAAQATRASAAAISTNVHASAAPAPSSGHALHDGLAPTPTNVVVAAQASAPAHSGHASGAAIPTNVVVAAQASAPAHSGHASGAAIPTNVVAAAQASAPAHSGHASAAATPTNVVAAAPRAPATHSAHEVAPSNHTHVASAPPQVNALAAPAPAPAHATRDHAALAHSTPVGATAHAAPHRVVHAGASAVPAAPFAAAALAQPARVAVAVLEPAPAADDAVIAGVLTELRAAIRGQPADVLAASLHTSLDSVRAACAALMTQGQVVRRGHKYFVA